MTARSKGKVERPFRTVKEMHENLYHFHGGKEGDRSNIGFGQISDSQPIGGVVAYKKRYRRQGRSSPTPVISDCGSLRKPTASPPSAFICAIMNIRRRR